MARDLCIIGQEKSESDIALLAEAKKKFDSVFFVPIDGIGIGLSETFSISYRSTNLFRFPAVFARIPRSYTSYAYQILSLFPAETFMPIKPLSFLIASERFFLLTVLRKRGVDTINLRLAKSKKAAERIIESSEYPFTIRVPEKKTGVVVEKRMEARTLIDALASLNQTIMIEEMTKEMVSVFVAGHDILASIKKKSKEKDIVFGLGSFKNTNINIDTEHLAREAASAIDSQVARIDISLDSDEPKVVNIDLNPNLVIPSRLGGINIPEKVMEYIAETFSTHLQRPLLVKFFEDARSVVKDVFK